MNSYVIGQAVGAIISQLILAAVLYLLLKRCPNTTLKLASIHAVAAIVAIVANAYGAADGGPLNFDSAPIRATAAVVLFALDWLRVRR